MTNKVQCNDGTYSITNGAEAPCLNSGGIKAPSKFDYSGINEILNKGGFPSSINILKPSVISNDKVALSVSNPSLVANMKLEEEKKFAEMKKKSLANTLAKASIVPIGLYAFSKYNKYDTKKTLKVTIIGSVVILGAVVLNGFSGAWSGTTFLDSLIGKSKKPEEPKFKLSEA